MSITPSADDAGQPDRPKSVDSPGTLPEVVEQTGGLRRTIRASSALFRARASDIAAVMIEPLMQGMGCVPLEPAILNFSDSS